MVRGSTRGWRPATRAKALEALRLRRQGLTLREIGERLGGLSRERARQLVEGAERLQRARRTQTTRVEGA